MLKSRRSHTAEFKAKVVTEAIHGVKSVNELGAQYDVHPTQITKWKRQVLDALPGLFSNHRQRAEKADEELKARLYQQIGQLQVELDWLKKSAALTLEEKRMRIERDHPHLSIARQCELLGLGRSALYYRPQRDEEYNDELRRLLDRQYTRTPFYGVARMSEWLRALGHPVNPKRVRRLLREMGLTAIYPKRRLSAPEGGVRRYPYLLRGLDISAPNHVWASDITYIPMRRGFVYLTAIVDWFSRYVLDWAVSGSLDASFCVEATARALHSARPGIFNTDQGAQFTSEAFTALLASHGVRISMDGRGRTFDNIFVERLWRTVKYEEAYLKDYASQEELRTSLDAYFEFYNHERLHQALGYRSPAEVYFERRERVHGGMSSAARSAVTPVSLRLPSVTADRDMALESCLNSVRFLS